MGGPRSGVAHDGGATTWATSSMPVGWRPRCLDELPSTTSSTDPGILEDQARPLWSRLSAGSQGSGLLDAAADALDASMAAGCG